MKTLNKLANEFNKTKSEAVFTEIYERVIPIVKALVGEVARNRDRAFSIDLQDIESNISYESLLKALSTYVEGKGNFNNWFYGVAKLDIKNLIRLQGAKKHSPTNGYVSLFIELEGEFDGYLWEVLEDKHTDIDAQVDNEFKSGLLSVIFEEFKAEYPREYAAIMATAKYEDDREARKNAYMEIYSDITDKWGTVRTRVSRAKDLFVKFMLERGYNL